MCPLIPNALYIIMFLTGFGQEPRKFHWGVYLHIQNLSGGKPAGYNYHIKSIGTGWMTDHAPTNGVLMSFVLVGLLAVATIPTEHRPLFEAIVTSEDHKINAGGITCRLWTLAALQRLKDARLLKCASISDLEQEAISFGESFRLDAVAAKLPRPIQNSQLCQI
ncbi:hypothetical protein SERLA73DRAFT_78282 [Serpula lacrymans var. lacrymans S7.3]|uniref:Uncharacterized protein n=2 Tax=Serpula lacrymans var. lacrymans TaxID=341189 RepID=F8QCN9_SERL3|nr:uncharacterized protein SERLADRAFT_411774 [Serpula lacrymans var. lacrymans S7.9]EGN93904.1 hypothetical protein SERLA73DRAFT_78282 [Serpula lacrymans var. lacrymans S7.3]EGO19272.1 hypothetical protein SERLADRAFT_411774 [Serpula lacrymans var. lacrymans S7.9]